MTTSIQQSPYLRNQRSFPEDPQALSVENSKSYIEIASAVNLRTIGIYPLKTPVANGESWYIMGGNQRQQALRQVYVFTSTASIAHGINVQDSNQFTTCSGSYTDGTSSYGLFFASSVAIAGQITFYVTATQIVFATGSGAPTLTKGRIVLEWLAVAQAN